MIGPVNHNPQQLRQGLLRTSGPVVLDVETTGLNVRRDRILSIGLRFDAENHILFLERCSHVSITPVKTSDDLARWALEPLLIRSGLRVIGHNPKFDLAMLRRLGIRYTGEVVDTESLLRLLDQDRGPITDKKTRTRPRLDLATTCDDRRHLNYKLKHVVTQLLSILPVFTPNLNMDLVPFATHRRYLASDLYCTEQLYRYLWQKTTPTQRAWCQAVGSPLLHMLLELSEIGVAADMDFITTEVERMRTAMQAISDAHLQQHGVALLGMGNWHLQKLLYITYKLPHKNAKGKWPVNDEMLGRLLSLATGPMANSLLLIRGFRQLDSLRTRLGGYIQYIDRREGRIFSQFSNRQATGRVSSTEPNLQQLAKPKTILKGTPYETQVISRNMLVATPGYTLVAADIEQADPRVLAHGIASCRISTTTLVQDLYQRLDVDRYSDLLGACRNVNYNGPVEPQLPPFDPASRHRLVDDFRSSSGDLYCRVAGNIAGKTIGKSDPERKIYKRVLLAQVNGQTSTGLSQSLNCPKTEAQEYIDKFFAYYDDIYTWLGLKRLEVAITGQTETWKGRTRTITAHRWMVTERRVRVLLTYANGDKFWYDVEPIRPSLRTLTCYVRRIWSVRDWRHPRLIYTADRGRIGSYRYASIDTQELLYSLPVRNLPWRSVRRVQKLDAAASPIEEARYEGFDTTARVAINAIMQGGTMDIVTSMMLRTRDLVREFGARLLLQIHDELVWECPEERLGSFVLALRAELETTPEGFLIPIQVSMKAGRRFGELRSI